MNKLLIIPIILISCLNGQYKTEQTIELDIGENPVTFVIDSVSISDTDIYVEGYIKEDYPSPVIPDTNEEINNEQSQYEQTMKQTKTRLDSVYNTIDSIKVLLKERIKNKKVR